MSLLNTSYHLSLPVGGDLEEGTHHFPRFLAGGLEDHAEGAVAHHTLSHVVDALLRLPLHALASLSMET